MNVKYLFSSILILTTICFGCKPAKIVQAEKYKVIPGVATATPVYNYEVVVQLKKESIFNHIILGSNTKITSFSVKDVSTQMSSDNSRKYPKGAYSLQFSVPITQGLKEGEEIFLELTENGKVKILSSSVVLMADKKLK